MQLPCLQTRLVTTRSSHPPSLCPFLQSRERQEKKRVKHNHYLLASCSYWHFQPQPAPTVPKNVYINKLNVHKFSSAPIQITKSNLWHVLPSLFIPKQGTRFSFRRFVMFHSYQTITAHLRQLFSFFLSIFPLLGVSTVGTL